MTHNQQAKWVATVESDLREVPGEDEVRIFITDVHEVLADMPYWKAPGPDGVQWYLIKKFTSCHNAMARMLLKRMPAGCRSASLDESWSHSSGHERPWQECR